MTLRLMAHNPQWTQEFDQSRSMLLHATEGWLTEIQHIGSTAVPDMVARPVIDMVAGIEDLQGLNEAAGLVEGLNYVREAAPVWCQDELAAWLQKPRSGERTHSLLIVRKQGPAWKRCLAIRDLLSQQLVIRQYLESLKRDHFQPGCDAEQRYDLAKASFFDDLGSLLDEL